MISSMCLTSHVKVSLTHITLQYGLAKCHKCPPALSVILVSKFVEILSIFVYTKVCYLTVVKIVLKLLKIYNSEIKGVVVWRRLPVGLENRVR